MKTTYEEAGVGIPEKMIERVKAGASFMDEKYPGWANRMNLDSFSIADSCNCVLGQSFGDFWGALRAIKKMPSVSIIDDIMTWPTDPIMTWAVDHGFWAEDPDDDIREIEWLTLAEVWIYAIKIRKTSLEQTEPENQDA